MAESQKRILVAEDERPIARALELKLSAAGYSVTTVFNGEDAILELSKNDFDLLLLDLIMPKVDGFGVLESMRSKKIGVPVIVLSNLSQEEDLKRAKELGVKDYFVKSDNPISEIIDHVRKALIV